MDGESFVQRQERLSREQTAKRSANAGCALAVLTIALALICGFTALGVAWILK